ncbi:IS30 family transposase [Salinicola sp. LHM]|uniref:IS30 family transposase n=1 Tax=Salinicola sp. LHM TaxID=3065298 RepID=UPI002ACDA619|nr:IS30 family transposase [Salinicola sp. LHM]WQH33485.1 IS30 family transposase [Salinicola sp. LHM]
MGIEHRLAEVYDRLFIGHWEGDPVIQGHTQSGLVTLAVRLPRISAELPQTGMICLLKPRRGADQTITLDSGSEFAGHKSVAKAVTAATYFCGPYCPGQRGANENTNSLVRQYFPKGTDVTGTELRKAVRKPNDLPESASTGTGIPGGEYSGAPNTAGDALIA